MFYWSLRTPATGITLEVLDAEGRLARRLSSPAPDKAGLNRATWDLRYPGAATFPGMIVRSANPGRGPIAAPGRYQVRLTVGAHTEVRPFSVVRNPTLTGVTDADLAEQFALAMKIRDKTSETHDAIIAIRDMKAQIADRLARTSDAAVAAAAGSFTKTIGSVEEDLYQVKNRSPKDPLNFPVKLNNRIAALQRVVESAEARPTDQSYVVFKLLSDELAGCLARLDAALKTDLPRLNKLLAAGKLEPVRTIRQP